MRTELQQAWAELSEKLSDLVDPSIKYGRGDEDIIELLAEASMAVAEQENLEFSALETQAGIDKLSNDDLTDDVRDVIVRFKELFDSHKADLAAAREDVLNELRIAAERFEE